MISPTDKQWAAIRAIVEWYKNSPAQEFYLAGYAGTGKSTTVSIAIEELRSVGVSTVISCAYTGKAAHVMRKKGVHNATTIHSAIYQPVIDKRGNVQFIINDVGPASTADLIILDECSMVSEDLADDIRSFGKKILVIGDPGQLQPVKGQGAFTSRLPDFFLDEIHRQAADSPIIHLATLARRGENIALGDYDGTTVALLRDRRDMVYVPDTQVIVGTHATRWAITQNVRKRMGIESKLPVAGEKLICCKNHRDAGLFNGSMAVAATDFVPFTGLTPATMEVLVDDASEPQKFVVTDAPFLECYDGEKRELPRKKDIEVFDWGYAITCHKSQGSEFDHVTVVDDSRAFREDSARWLYTALTRGSEGLTLLKRAA